MAYAARTSIATGCLDTLHRDQAMNFIGKRTDRLLSPAALLLVLAFAGGAASLLPLDASAQYFGRNKVQYENFEWQILNTPHFEIFFYPEAEELAVRAAVIAEDAYLRLSRVFGHEFGQQVPFILYASPNDFQQTNISEGFIGEGTGGFSEPMRNRMVLPYPGDNAGFVHVINHELVHVFMFDIVYKSLQSNDVRRRWFPVELWFAEGMAEWFSSGWEQNADMWMRDATIYDWVVPLPQIYGGYQVYKQGQSAMRYIANTYGEEKVVELFETLGRTSNVDRALLQTIGLDTEDFSEEWIKSLKKEYWVEYSDKQEPTSIGRRLTDHWEERAYFFQQPSISPDGRYIAFFSDYEGLVDLFLMDAIEGKVIRKLVTGYRSNRFLTLHSFESSIGFSPDSRMVTFVAKSGQDEHLFAVDVESGDVVHEVPLRMDIARSPSWSPVDDKVVLNGTRNGRTDLYLVDFSEKSVVALTDDFTDEHSPTWYPDGERILYSAYPAATDEIKFDRDASGLLRLEPRVVQEPRLRAVGTGHDLFALDLETGDRELVLSTGGDDQDPILVDENTIVFVSDLTGVMNLYSYDIEAGELRRLTDVLGGIFHPSVSAATDRLTFTAFDRAGFDIFLRENFSTLMAEADFPQDPPAQFAGIPMPRTQGADATEPTDDLGPLVLAGSRSLKGVKPAQADELPANTVAQVALTERRQRARDQGLVPATTRADSEASEDVETAELQDEPPARTAADSVSAEEETPSSDEPVDLAQPENEPEYSSPAEAAGRTIGTVQPYRLRFSLDPVGSGYGGAYYAQGVGLGVAQLISASDLLGNHRMQFLVNFYGSLENSDLAASYYYLKRRVNLAGGIFHYRNFINSNFTSLGEVYDRNRLFSERNYGVFGLASYPFSQFNRVDFEVQAFVSEKTFYDYDQFSGFYFESGKERDRLLQPSLSYVHDSTFYGSMGPITGSRWLVSFSPAVPLSDDDVDRVTTFVDYRRYFRMWDRNSLAFRVVGAQSNGSNPRNFVVGGPWTLRGWDVFDFEDVDAVGDPLNPGLLGRKMLLMNLEYRFPAVDALILGWPGRWGIGGVEGAAFFDTGAAFDDEIKLTRSGRGLLQLDELNANVGVGVRVNVGWLPLKFDWAWKTDLTGIEPGAQFHFSIGPQF